MDDDLGGSAEMAWQAVDIADGVRIRYGSAGAGSRTMLLIHGWPETAIAWRKVVAPLARAGFRIITPDVRGAGGSSRPASGYDKANLAADLAHVLDHAGVSGHCIVVGHDIGAMIAYAFARRYPERTERLAVLDAAMPGTAVFEQMWQSGAIWHFHFHQAPDIPEMLTSGRERLYLEQIWRSLFYNAGAMDEETKVSYVSDYSAPGGMRAGFELYRAFARDIEHNRQDLDEHGRMNMPVLAVAGEASIGTALMEQMAREVAEDVRLVVIPKAGHWIAEENPDLLAKTLIDFATPDQGAS